MRSFLAVVAVVVVVAVVSSVSAADTPERLLQEISLQEHHLMRDDNSWDYMLLVVRWAPTVCAQHNDCIYPSNATAVNVHGLWPNRNDGSWPAYCDNSYPFNITQIDPIYGRLLEMWTSFFGGADSTPGFYEHEWEKHGTCAIQGGKGLDNELDYFQAVMNLWENLGAEAALQSAGIVPDNQKMYSTSDIQGAINQAIGHTPSVSCSQVNGKPALNEIQVCVSKALEFQECPQSPTPGCDSVELLVPQN